MFESLRAKYDESYEVKDMSMPGSSQLVIGDGDDWVVIEDLQDGYRVVLKRDGRSGTPDRLKTVSDDEVIGAVEEFISEL